MMNNVLILSASAGAGHTRAAQAIERTLVETGAARTVRHVDTLEYTNKLFRNIYSKAYIDMANKSPEVLGWLYDQTDRPWKNERMRLAFDKLSTGPFIRMIERNQPQIVVCTHFLPAEIISYLKAKGRITSRQAIVVTDFDIHAMWLCHHYEHYFVPIDETREHMTQLGIPAAKISVSGIPIDPVFSIVRDKMEMRRACGLDADRVTILLSTGGFGVGPMEHLMASLLRLRHRAQVVAICGRNAELKERIDRMAAEIPEGANVTVKPVGFTTKMDEYMAASDIVLGKPGGLTTSEALARGLVFVIVNPIPGQEERNADHLLEEWVGIRCNNLPALAYKIDRLLDDPARFEIMRQNSLRMGRPHAAFTIVEKVRSIVAQPSEAQAHQSAAEYLA